jgi:hypothetical protein
MNTRTFHRVSGSRSKFRRRKPAHSIYKSSLSRGTPLFVFGVESVAGSSRFRRRKHPRTRRRNSSGVARLWGLRSRIQLHKLKGVCTIGGDTFSASCPGSRGSPLREERDQFPPIAPTLANQSSSVHSIRSPCMSDRQLTSTAICLWERHSLEFVVRDN